MSGPVRLGVWQGQKWLLPVSVSRAAFARMMNMLIQEKETKNEEDRTAVCGT